MNLYQLAHNLSDTEIVFALCLLFISFPLMIVFAGRGIFWYQETLLWKNRYQEMRKTAEFWCRLANHPES